jgi:outer membrane biosynthesis protein TonB
MILKTKNLRPIALSLGMHLCIMLCCLCFFFMAATQEKPFELNVIKPMWANLLVTPHTIAKPEPRAIQRIQPSAKTLLATQPKQSVKPQTIQQKNSEQRLGQKASKGDPLSPWMQSVYHQISEHYHVSEKAVELHESGTTWVSFLLLQNGTALHLSVKQSSGYRLLDLFALRSVQEASPFNLAPFRIKKPELLLMPIDFQPKASS